MAKASRDGARKTTEVKYKPLSEAGKAALREYYLAGYTAQQIADAMGKSLVSIRAYLRRLGIARGKKDQIAEHLAEGLSIREAGEAIGISPAAAKSMFKRVRADLGPQAI
jgi:DNA-directed RNA polymerase specialized sigma24 family protein